MVSNAKLDVMLQAADHIVCQEFARTGGVWQRGVVVLPDRMELVPLKWDDDATKVEAILRFKRKVRQEGGTEYLMIGEAWMAPWSERGDKLIRASRSDRRREVVYLLAADLSGSNLFGFREVEPMFVSAPPGRRLGPLSVEEDIDGFMGGRIDYGDI